MKNTSSSTLTSVSVLDTSISFKTIYNLEITVVNSNQETKTLYLSTGVFCHLDLNEFVNQYFGRDWLICHVCGERKSLRILRSVVLNEKGKKRQTSQVEILSVKEIGNAFPIDKNVNDQWCKNNR